MAAISRPGGSPRGVQVVVPRPWRMPLRTANISGSLAQLSGKVYPSRGSGTVGSGSVGSGAPVGSSVASGSVSS